MFGTPVLGQMLEKKASSLLFREKIKSSYPKVLMNNLAEDVDKRPPNGGYCLLGRAIPSSMDMFSTLDFVLCQCLSCLRS